MMRIALLLALAATAFAAPEVNIKFSTEELQRYFGVDSHEKAPEYEIVYPEFISAEGKRSIGRSAIAASSLLVHVDAFGQQLRMTVEHDDSNIKPGLEVEYETEEGVVKVPLRTDCLYSGKVDGESKSMVTVSTCAGLLAIMNHASGPTFIEPLDDEHAIPRDIGRGLPHVAYKSKPDDGATCPVTEDSVYAQFREEPDKDLDINPESTKYLKLAFIGDESVYNIRGSNTANCMTTLFTAVKNVMQLSSLAGSNLVPKLTYTKIYTTSSGSPSLSTNSDTSIVNARTWNSQSSRYTGWDNVAVLSGYSMGNTLGIAYVGNCGNSYAVSVSSFRNLDTTNVVAHEIGHNLDMSHDSNGNSCSSSGYIMGAYVNDHRDDPSWSSCSKSYYNTFAWSSSCYNDS